MSENLTKQNNLQEYPMKWHKFLIYFALFAGALLNLYNAVMVGTGGIYGSSDSTEWVYANYPGLKSLDTIFAIVYLGLAVLNIVARFRLAGYYANGPKLVVLIYVLNIAVQLVYNIAAASIADLPLSDVLGSSTWGQYIGSLVVAIATWNYYQKRAELFRN